MNAGLTLTRELVRRHGRRSDTYGAALLDVAQDHLLWLLADGGHFDHGDLVFKGGTSLRKCRLGVLGRFSTDLDFAAPDDDTVLRVCEAIDGASVSGFAFSLRSTRGDGRHWAMTVTHPTLGSPDMAAAVEFARRPLILPPEPLGFLPVAIHASYALPTLPTMPVINLNEAVAEKLARYRRTALARDVYDLAQFATTGIDDALVRRLWVLKVWGDVVDDGRGAKPLAPADVLTQKREKDFAPESIGKLTQPIDVVGWERTVRRRYQFLAELTEEDEARWAACDPRDRYDVERAIAALRPPESAS